MANKWNVLIVILLFVATTVNAQFGIRAGVNMANEINTFTQGSFANAFSSEKLTGYHIGILHQSILDETGFGGDVALLFSQKGSSYTNAIDTENPIDGYRELNYLEMPFNARYQMCIGFATLYATSGLYTAFFVSGKEVSQSVSENILIDNFVNRLDFGYNFGCGLELFSKIQLGLSWSHGLRSNNAAYTSTVNCISSSQNKVFSINLGYLF